MGDSLVENVGSLVENARQAHVPVVWIQHSDEQLARVSDDRRTPDDAEPLVESYPPLVRGHGARNRVV
jgi:hypothetical protein